MRRAPRPELHCRAATARSSLYRNFPATPRSARLLPPEKLGEAGAFFPRGHSAGGKSLWPAESARLLDNQELAPQVVSEPQKDTFRISFDAAWPRRARHAIEIAYDLTAGVESDPRIVMGRDAFLLCSGSWYPLLLPVKGIFAKGGERPDPTQISIWVPKDFVALSSGRAAGTHRRNGEFEHRFRLSRQDFDPLSSRAAITSRRCKRPMAQSSSGRSNPPRPSKCNARARVSRPR